MPSTTSDADYVALTIREIFSDSDPNNRANSLRSLFAETLDFTPEQGTIPLDPNDGLTQSAHQIATRNGITVAYVAISDPGKTRVNKSDATTASKSIKRTTHDDLFMVFSNGPNDRLEFVWKLQIEDREELRKIVINREMPQLTAPQLIADIYERTEASGSLHYALRQVFTDEAVEKPVVPENPTDIFLPHLEPLKDIYTELVNEPATQTKQKLWLDMLRGSGCAPESKDEQLEQFISHTLLVTIARAVIATVSDWERSEDPVSIMAEGFASWPQNRNERRPTHTAGVEWTREVFHTAATYDWRPRTRDVLRNIYQDLIPKDQRKAFGEYYTPDWLASMLTERVIDDEWIERAVERHLYNNDIPTRIGVLDPACGSGTFMYHAAQRILNSEALQRHNATPEQQAGFIARMVNGIDIHPIAVEISRATLMRALPAEPTDGIESLHIYQGDALIYTHRAMALANNDELPYYTLESPGGRYLRIPTEWAARPGFGHKVMRFVSAANQGEPMPTDTADGLLERDQRTLEHTYRTLQEVCREEGNSVWAWYIFNSVSPATLKERKVDRIVANPPWVRMSNIQVESRKRELEELITEMDLWPKRHTGFDIAGMFVTRCRELYLSPREGEKNRAAWVLNSAAIKGGNWQKVRSKSKIWNEEFIDFGEVKESPFTGAKSCALIQGVAQTEREPAQTKMVNLDKQKVRRSDNLATARTKSEIVPKPKEFVPKRSEYFTGEKPDFRVGNNIFPQSLVKVTKITAIKNGRVSFVTANSRHGPWTAFNGTLGEVPRSYVVESVFSNDLLAFAVRKRTTQVIIPLTGDGELDNERDREPYWNYAEECYQVNKGKGKGMPQTLWGILNYLNHLAYQIVQWQAAGSRQQAAGSRQQAAGKVVYNKSGQQLRAARSAPHYIADNSTYHMTAKTPEEAAYLVSMLNADCLQLAFQQSRKSDRDFHHHIWRTVPIPRYDAGSIHHQSLATLCVQAEQTAERVRDSMVADAGQIKISDTIRRTLRETGIASKIDDQVRAILPNHTTSSRIA